MPSYKKTRNSNYRNPVSARIPCAQKRRKCQRKFSWYRISPSDIACLAYFHPGAKSQVEGAFEFLRGSHDRRSFPSSKFLSFSKLPRSSIVSRIERERLRPRFSASYRVSRYEAVFRHRIGEAKTLPRELVFEFPDRVYGAYLSRLRRRLFILRTRNTCFAPVLALLSTSTEAGLDFQ